MTDKSILMQMDEEGHKAPRVKLKGTERDSQATERYEVVGEVARGGVGVVHRGRDNDIGRDVALKVLHDKHLEDPELVQRFVEEAQIGGQLQHPGIVPVFELGLRGDQRPYFAMKLVKGETLAKRLAKRSDPAQDRRANLTVFREVCRTMAYAHARGVIHRDLKPSNVMIGNFGEVQVVDWGFAKVMRTGGIADESLASKVERDRTMISTVRSDEGGAPSLAGSVMGTPAYMPPEQALGRVEELDEKSDLFSLGAILAEILTGKPPYTGGDNDRLTAAAQARLAPALERLDACGADPDLVTLCKHCLEPLPADRPLSAEVIADGVANYLANTEVRAHRAQVRAVKAEAEAEEQQRRRMQTRIVGGGVLTALVLAAGAWLWIDGERKTRMRERQAAIETALQDAERLGAAKDWPGALAAADRAIQLGHDGALVEKIRAQAAAETERVRREREADEFLAELETIRSRWGQEDLAARGVADDGGTSWEQQQRATDAAYTAAFERRFGSLDGAQARLLASRHRETLAANLTFWCWMRRTLSGLEGSDWQAVDRLARALDPGNDRVRDALVARDAETLLALTREPPASLPPSLAAHIGMALEAAGRPDEALAFLRDRSRRAPGHYWIHSRITAGALRAGRPGLAARHGTAAVALQPDDASAWSSLALALSRIHRDAEATAAFRRAIALDADNAILRSNFAVHLAGLGELKEAIQQTRKAVALEPTYASGYSHLGLALSQAGQPEEAEAALRMAIDLRPDHANTWANLAAVLGRKGDAEAEEKAYRKALQIDPECALALSNLGVQLVARGEIDKGIEHHKRAVAAEPKVAEYHNNLGCALRDRGDYPAAGAAHRRAIELKPRDAAGYRNLGTVLSMQGDSRGARRQYLKALELDPRDASTHYNLGYQDVLEGRSEAALAHMRKALECDPTHVMAHGVLGALLSNAGDLDGGLRHLRLAEKLRPNSVRNLTNIGITLYRKRDLKGAAATLRRALVLAEFPLARQYLQHVEQELALLPLVERVVSGEAIEVEPGVRAQVARLLLDQKQFAVAAAQYAQAFEEAPELAIDLQASHRYNAACSAAHVGGTWHARALAWLRADLELRTAQLERAPAEVVSALRHWTTDPDLASIRDVEDLSEAFNKLWTDVEAVLERARAAKGG